MKYNVKSDCSLATNKHPKINLDGTHVDPGTTEELDIYVMIQTLSGPLSLPHASTGIAEAVILCNVVALAYLRFIRDHLFR